MSANWPLVPIGSIAESVERPINVTPGESYRTIGVKWWGEGAYERETIDGSETAARTLYRVKAGDLIINKIWVRHGSTAIATDAVDGCAASGEFPMFALNPEKAETRWLHWLTKSAWFWHRCDQLSQGTSGKNRIKPEKFLTIPIPLPPLAEQRRIVSRVDAIAARIADARRLREEADTETGPLLGAAADKQFDALLQFHEMRPLGDFDPHVTSGPRNWAANYVSAGTRFYRAQDIQQDGRLATQDKVFIDVAGVTTGQGARLADGDLMLVITGATVGRVAVYSTTHEPGYVSQHVAICRLPAESLLPEFVHWRLKSNAGREQLIGSRYGQGKPGLNLSNIRNLSLPVPPLAEQRRIVAHLDALQAKADALRSLQAEASAEMDALLPAVLAKAFAGEL